MERHRVQLPSLFEQPNNAKTENLKEFRMWEECKKKAYHAQLDRELEQRRKSREKSAEEKTYERMNIGTLVQEEQAKKASQKWTKTKTEQKYMQENYKLMKKDKNTKKTKQWWGDCLEHPFVALLDQEQKRKKQTKRNFIFQNQLNNIQSEMKRSVRKRKTEEARTEAKNYIDFIESDFDRKLRDRMRFEQKYLKLDTTSDQSYKKQHLSFLKEQGEKRYSQLSNKSQEITRTKPSSLQGYDNTEKERLRESSARKLEHELSLRKQFTMNIIAQNPHPHPIQKTVTERAEVNPERNRAVSSMNSSRLIQYTEFSQRPRKEYKHYDIINNCQKVIAT